MVDLVGGIQADDWYLANVKQYGYFRINYDAENWARLTTQLNTDHLVNMLVFFFLFFFFLHILEYAYSMWH